MSGQGWKYQQTQGHFMKHNIKQSEATSQTNDAWLRRSHATQWEQAVTSAS